MSDQQQPRCPALLRVHERQRSPELRACGISSHVPLLHRAVALHRPRMVVPHRAQPRAGASAAQDARSGPTRADLEHGCPEQVLGKPKRGGRGARVDARRVVPDLVSLQGAAVWCADDPCKGLVHRAPRHPADGPAHDDPVRVLADRDDVYVPAAGWPVPLHLDRDLHRHPAPALLQHRLQPPDGSHAAEHAPGDEPDRLRAPPPPGHRAHVQSVPRLHGLLPHRTGDAVRGADVSALGADAVALHSHQPDCRLASLPLGGLPFPLAQPAPAGPGDACAAGRCRGARAGPLRDRPRRQPLRRHQQGGAGVGRRGCRRKGPRQRRGPRPVAHRGCGRCR
mmetsp:Transcript_51339/g.77980  ORF Transcript_51339/g.77980 Transcript_51339/m.77980 type:complete len:338 (-) Transcript_51339:591-1604(-)